MAKTSKALGGKTIHFKFTDGPTAGNVYEHRFYKNGTVVWRSVGGAPAKQESKGEKKKPKPTPYASYQIAPGIQLMSYLAESGYTLTLSLNLRTRRIHGYASNDKEWFPVSGTLQVQK